MKSNEVALTPLCINTERVSMRFRLKSSSLLESSRRFSLEWKPMKWILEKLVAFWISFRIPFVSLHRLSKLCVFACIWNWIFQFKQKKLADATLWQDYLGGIIQFNCGREANHAVQIVGYNLGEFVGLIRSSIQWELHYCTLNNDCLTIALYTVQWSVSIRDSLISTSVPNSSFGRKKIIFYFFSFPFLLHYSFFLFLLINSLHITSLHSPSWFFHLTFPLQKPKRPTTSSATPGARASAWTAICMWRSEATCAHWKNACQH